MAFQLLELDVTKMISSCKQNYQVKGTHIKILIPSVVCFPKMLMLIHTLCMERGRICFLTPLCIVFLISDFLVGGKGASFIALICTLLITIIGNYNYLYLLNIIVGDYNYLYLLNIYISYETKCF